MVILGDFELVFVYGTLRKEGSNGFRMGSSRCLGAGTVGGDLYRIDWYPGLVLGGENAVIGELYEVARCDLSALDEYEGDAYRRKKVSVTMENGQAIEAWIWEYIQEISGLERIPSGDWLA